MKLEDQAAKKQIIEVKILKNPISFELSTGSFFTCTLKDIEKIGLIIVAQIHVEKLIKEIDNENSDGVILDLRGGGGSLYELQPAKIFLGRGNVIP